MALVKLLDNVSTNGAGPSQVTLGGDIVLLIWADNFGGGAVGFELSPDGLVWIPVTQNNFEFLAIQNRAVLLNRVGQGGKIRAVLKNSAGAVNVNAGYFN